MSKKKEFFEIFPEKGNKRNNPEIIESDSYECPECSGNGHFDHSGWSAKFKKDINDPDFPLCDRCGGTGKLHAIVMVKWVIGATKN